MKLAIVSDVHGNVEGLRRVLADAAAQGAEGYCLLGDYFGDFPWPNGVVEEMQTLPNAYIIGGNKEKYLVDYEKNPTLFDAYHQYAPIPWAYGALTPAHRTYLMELPQRLHWEVAGWQFTAAHRMEYAQLGICELTVSDYTRRVAGGEFRPEEYSAFLTEGFTKALAGRSLPPGIFLFGDRHVQWEVTLGDTLLLNPGSCGLPVDWQPGAAYSLLTLEEDWQVEHRRLDYDLSSVTEELYQSSLHRQAPLWTTIMARVLESGVSELDRFFVYARALSEKEGTRMEKNQPFPNEIWERAGKEWLERYQSPLESFD